MYKKYFTEESHATLQKAAKAKTEEEYSSLMSEAYKCCLDPELVKIASKLKWMELNEPKKYQLEKEKMQANIDKAAFMAKEKERIENEQAEKKKKDDEEAKWVEEFDSQLLVK